MSPLPFLLLGAVVFLSRWRDDAARPLALAARLVPVVDQGAGAILAQAGGHVAALAVVALVGAGLVVAGRAARRTVLPAARGLEAVVLDAGCGLAAASLLWLGLGLAGLAFPAVAAACVVAAAAAGAPGAARAARAARGHPGLVLAALVAVVPALVPETEIDALVYHLALPDAWARAHRIVLADPVWLGGYWLAQEALALPALLLGSEPAAKAVGLLALALAAGAAAALARRWTAGDRNAAGTAAAAVMLVSPAAVLGASRSKNDLLAAALVAAALVARAGGPSAARALLAGLLAGAAVACKNTAALAVPALAATYLVAPGRWRSLVPFVAGDLVPAVPWAARNGLALGNPFFPLVLAALPPPGMTGLDRALADRYTWLWRDAAPRGALAAAVTGVQLLAGFNPLAVPGWLAAAGRRGPGRWPALFLVVFAGLWLAGFAWFGRFALPLLVPLTALGAAGLAAPTDRGASSRLAAGAVACTLLAAVCGAPWRDAPLGCALGTESRAGYFRRVAGSWSEAAAALAAAVPAGRRALAVGEWRSYPAGGRVSARWIASESAVHELARACADAPRMRVRLRQWRVTHLLLNVPQAAYRASFAAARSWTPAAVRRWAGFFDRDAHMVWSSAAQDPVQGYFVLYRFGVGGTPYRAWLPGVDGEFDALRQALLASYNDSRVDQELARLDALLGPRAEVLARRGAVLALRGRNAEALAAFHRAAAAAPEARAAWTAFGANVMTRPAELATYTGLWREFVDMQVALGVPTALPPVR